MTAEADLARIGILLGDRTRAAILLALLNGDAQPASVLADAAGASRSLASSHLRKLLDGGLVDVEAVGRQRRYRLASGHVAEMLESVMFLAPAQPVTTLRQANRNAHLRHARLCYDHLAGVFGVAVTEGLVDRGALLVVDQGFELTSDGEPLMAELSVDLPALRRARRPLCRTCTDWTERREHLAGGLGAAVAGQMLQRGWIARRPGTRALDLTPAGCAEAARWLGVDLPAAA